MSGKLGDMEMVRSERVYGGGGGVLDGREGDFFGLGS